jgi:hypothetical protein
MIRRIAFFFIMVLPTLISSQTFIEKYRSEGNARNPLKRLIRNADDTDLSIKDFNNNGIEDFILLTEENDGIRIIGYDGGGNDEIFNIGVPPEWQFYPGDQLSTDIKLFGFGPAGLDYLIIIMENYNQEGDRIYIINPKNAQDNIFIPGRLALIADMDGDNWIDVLSVDFTDRSLVVTGIDNGGKKSRGNDPDFNQRGKQEVTLIYESEPDIRLNIDALVPKSTATQDINGDGAVDVIVVRRDDNDRVTGLRIVDVVTKEILFEQLFDEMGDDINRLHGYYDIDGDGVKEVILNDDIILSQEGELSRISENFRIEGILDMNGDGIVDVVGINKETSSIQIWGINNSTSVEDIEEQLGISGITNYPNPFQTTTTIAYQLEKPGNVRIELRDIKGALISTVHPGKKNIGIHQEEINLDEAQAGIYYYSIIVDGKALTQKMIKL